MDDPVTWTVGKQNHTTRFVDGTGVAGVDIPVTLSTGETFVTFVDEDTYRQGVDAVRAAIQADVEHHVGIARLSGEA